MGMFNYIKGEFTLACCQKPTTGWQSKSTTVIGRSGQEYHIDNYMVQIPQEDVGHSQFYNYCATCHKMTYYTIIEGKLTGVKLE